MLLPTSCSLPTYANYIHLEVRELDLAGSNIPGLQIIVPIPSDYANKKAVTL